MVVEFDLSGVLEKKAWKMKFVEIGNIAWGDLTQLAFMEGT